MRVKCSAQKHDTMSPARAGTQTARSGDERTNHEATAPPHTQERMKETRVNPICRPDSSPKTYPSQVIVRPLPASEFPGASKNRRS